MSLHVNLLRPTSIEFHLTLARLICLVMVSAAIWTKKTRSTCQLAFRRCEQNEICQWHLSELQMKCPLVDSQEHRCVRDQCAKAIGRFARYVPAQIVEAMMFCQCQFSDGACTHLQHWMYPRCLYSTSDQNHKSSSSKKLPPKPQSTAKLLELTRPQWSCTQTVRMCQNDPNCSRHLYALQHSCELSNLTNPLGESNGGECVTEDLRKCREAIIQARGSWLEAPCYCNRTAGNDMRSDGNGDCVRWLNMVLPNNPCIEAAMLDFSRHFTAEAESEVSSGFDTPSTTSSTLVEYTLQSKEGTEHQSNANFTNQNFIAKDTKKTDKEVDPDLAEISLGDEVTLLPDMPELESKNKGEEYEDTTNATTRILIQRPKSTTQTQKPRKTSTTRTRPRPTKTTKTTNTKTIITKTTPMPANLNLTQNPSGLTRSNSNISGDSEDSVSGGQNLSDAVALELAKRQELRAKQGQHQTLLPTGEYVTQRPPLEGGCATRNIDGEWIVHYKDTIFRKYQDWSGRCSSWCECTSKETLKCHELGCLSDVLCEADNKLTTVKFGEVLYLEDRGACQCHDGKFICDTSKAVSALEAGLYISLGYSKPEVTMIKEKVPKNFLERSGLVSASSSLASDIASRLQFALERTLPKGTLCRIAVLEHFTQESVILLQLQWYGSDPTANGTTQPKWHSGKMEKHCSKHVRELEHNFLLERADRYQLVLSTVKQLRVIDLLDELPPSAGIRPAIILCNILFLSFFQFYTF